MLLGGGEQAGEGAGGGLVLQGGGGEDDVPQRACRRVVLCRTRAHTRARTHGRRERSVPQGNFSCCIVWHRAIFCMMP